MAHKKTTKLITLFAIITACFIPSIFSSGCMFDPGTTTTVSDSTTYRVNGKVYKPDLTYLAGIDVSLFDTVNSVRSSISKTDTNGSFSITFPYIRKRSLRIDFDVPVTLSALYSSKRDTILFEDDYFKNNYTKSQDATMQSK